MDLSNTIYDRKTPLGSLCVNHHPEIPEVKGVEARII